MSRISFSSFSKASILLFNAPISVSFSLSLSSQKAFRSLSLDILVNTGAITLKNLGKRYVKEIEGLCDLAFTLVGDDVLPLLGGVH